MKEKMNTDKFTDRDWEELASALSGEKEGKSELLNRFLAEEGNITQEIWEKLGKMNDEKKINVDKAWDKVYSRINESGHITEKTPSGIIGMRNTFLKIAAAALILLSLGTVTLYFATMNKQIVVTTANDQKNLKASLPDGSDIFLNRNTELIYSANFGKSGRHVVLSGEAFFEISPDPSKPFTVDAGKASIEVLGTSFNIITNNPDSAVEVYVETGKVLLSDNTGTQNIVLDPGYVGTIDTKLSGKTLNDNPNYISWLTGKLVFDRQRLEIVFKDLKRVYDMNIIADDPAILDETWTSSVDNKSQDTIIRLICASFNLRYTQDGNVYHLSKE
jgi:transmembrane sensor